MRTNEIMVSPSRIRAPDRLGPLGLCQLGHHESIADVYVELIPGSSAARMALESTEDAGGSDSNEAVLPAHSDIGKLIPAPNGIDARERPLSMSTAATHE